jgi:hypothetical protein
METGEQIFPFRTRTVGIITLMATGKMTLIHALVMMLDVCTAATAPAHMLAPLSQAFGPEPSVTLPCSVLLQRKSMCCHQTMGHGQAYSMVGITREHIPNRELLVTTQDRLYQFPTPTQATLLGSGIRIQGVMYPRRR